MITLLDHMECTKCGKRSRSIDMFVKPLTLETAECIECYSKEKNIPYEEHKCEVCGALMGHQGVCEFCDVMYSLHGAYAFFGHNKRGKLHRKVKTRYRIKLSNLARRMASLMDTTDPTVLSKRTFQINTMWSCLFTKHALSQFNKDMQVYTTGCIMNDAMVNYTPGEDDNTNSIIIE